MKHSAGSVGGQFRRTHSMPRVVTRGGGIFPIVFVILLLLTALMAAMLQQSVQHAREADQQFDVTQIEWLADAAISSEQLLPGQSAPPQSKQELPAGSVYSRHAATITRNTTDDGTVTLLAEMQAEGPLRVHAIRTVTVSGSDNPEEAKE